MADDKVVIGFFAKALFDFSGSSEHNQIPLVKDEVLFVFEDLKTGWSSGRNAAGNVGYFPSNFASKLDGVTLPGVGSSGSEYTSDEKDPKLVAFEDHLNTLLAMDASVELKPLVSEFRLEHGISTAMVVSTVKHMKLLSSECDRLGIPAPAPVVVEVAPAMPAADSPTTAPVRTPSPSIASDGSVPSRRPTKPTGPNPALVPPMPPPPPARKKVALLPVKSSLAAPLPEGRSGPSATVVEAPGASKSSLLARSATSPTSVDATPTSPDATSPVDVVHKATVFREERFRRGSAMVGGAGGRILPINLAVDIETFSIQGYANMYFQRSTTKEVKIDKLLSFSNVPLTASLNHLGTRYEGECLIVFQQILDYMGDGPKGGAIAGSSGLRAVIAKAAMPRTLPDSTQLFKDVGDEVYCQLMKQTTCNPDITSEWRGWQLMAACAAVAKPSVHLYNYVVRFIVNATKRFDVCGAMAIYTLRKMFGEPGVVSDESLGEASRMIPSENPFGGSISGIIYLEAARSSLCSLALVSDGEPDYGAVKAGVRSVRLKAGLKVSCPVLIHRDLLVQGAMMNKKMGDEKNYTERWITVSPDLSTIQWAKAQGDRKKKEVRLADVIEVKAGLPRSLNKYDSKEDPDMEKKVFSLVFKSSGVSGIGLVKEKDTLDLYAYAQPERDLWVHAIDALLLCRKENHSHSRDEFVAASNIVAEAFGALPPLHRVPRVLETLANHVIDNGGYEAEGIFRLSVSGDDEMTYTKILNSGHYGKMSECKNPCVSAVLIKKWLRSLSPPLVDTHLYEEAVAAGEKENIADCIAVVQKLKPLEFATFDYLFKFINDLSKHEDQTKMGSKNFAVVLTPNLLNDPSGDKMISLRNNNYEMNFVRLLIENSHLIVQADPSARKSSDGDLI